MTGHAEPCRCGAEAFKKGVSFGYTEGWAMGWEEAVLAQNRALIEMLRSTARLGGALPWPYERQ